jgi:hypothetical protein
MTAALRKLGAVFYVRTNQPQTIMHLETHSVYGRTVSLSCMILQAELRNSSIPTTRG